MKKSQVLYIASLLLLMACTEVKTQSRSCDSPDAEISCCFVNMPSGLTDQMLILSALPSADELIITGKILNPDNSPAAGAVLYAYHTDSKGYYSKSGSENGVQKWHGQFHGWCKTGDDGGYTIRTIRPARYPDNTLPAHIHAAIKTSDGRMTWINDFVFSDDTLVNERYVASLRGKGDSGVVKLNRDSLSRWVGFRDIKLN